LKIQITLPNTSGAGPLESGPTSSSFTFKNRYSVYDEG
jgi:hypothetical protein